MPQINFLNLILLFAGSFLAAFISGAAGFGGALLLLPVLSWSFGPAMAVPILTLAQLIGNLSRAYFGFKEIAWKPVMIFIAAAVPLAIIGALSFVSLPKDAVMRLVGFFVLIFALLKLIKILNFRPGNKTLLLGGGLTGLLSGLVGSGGPIGAAVFLSLNLSPMGYIASEAVTASAMHIVKTIIYQKYLAIGFTEIIISLLMGVFMILGTKAGKKLIEKMDKDKFTTFVTLLLGIIGIMMVITGS
ncbi:MAG: sulfite exporter TauE/SafE family protein [Firmicutes bacterium]|nr:sulfite exporter TauE/SafE family protein [Bacillota bacterium]